LPRGGGSSLAGQAVGEAIVMDMSRHMRQVKKLDLAASSVIVEPGMTLGLLNRQLTAQGLMFGPDPASAQRATIGGIIGNNASGAHSILYGMTADHVRRLKVVLASGECVWLDSKTESLDTLRTIMGKLATTHQADIDKRFPKTFRTVAGYALNKIDPSHVDLNWLFAGSEGTLGSIIEAELGLVPFVPVQNRCLVMVHFDSMIGSLEAVPRLLEVNPAAIELLDKMLITRTRKNRKFSPLLTFIEGDPTAVLVVEFYGKNQKELESQVQKLKTLLARMGHQDSVTLAITPEQQNQVWTVRKAGLGLLMSERSEAKPIAFIEDAAVPVESLADYIRDIDEAVLREGTTYGIYAHASAGCLHVRPLVNLKTLKGREQYRRIAEAATDATIKYQGTITGEHGQGLVRGEFTSRLFGDALSDAFRDIKRAFDPDNLMNPGKIIDSPAMDDPAILRYTPAYEVIPMRNRFDWSADGGFHGAIEMCNGAGVCRKEGTGTMCPSYMATLDEGHVTRGRANVLRMAISGQLPQGTANEDVKELLDLCLSCKACKSECPSSVDMARLKSEYIASYYDKHGIPFATRLFGNIHRVNRWGSMMPNVSNKMMGFAGVQKILRRLGIPTERPLPTFTQKRFSKSIDNRKVTNPQATLVIDTFTEFNHPEVGQAFLKITDALGIEVNVLRLPGQGCCGRPAISKGLLDLAKKIANENVEALTNQPTEHALLFLEPSCQSAFVDDYLALVDARLQDQAVRLAERCMSGERWLVSQLEDTEVKWNRGTAVSILLHGHCHQKALWGTVDTMKMLNMIPHVTVEEIDSGCCGVAGSFGYEHFDISMKIGNQRLLPTIKRNPDAIVVAPGTSCRAQINDAGSKALHPIELLANAVMPD
jgi:FAD/FMN-containing dehydrogenase/Fe-S oxidoreductase